MAGKTYLDQNGTQRLVEYIQSLLKTKIDISDEKQLSTEDFTTELKAKLEAIDLSSIVDLRQRDVEIYGGSASDLINEEGNG